MTVPGALGFRVDSVIVAFVGETSAGDRFAGYNSWILPHSMTDPMTTSVRTGSPTTPNRENSTSPDSVISKDAHVVVIVDPVSTGGERPRRVATPVPNLSARSPSQLAWLSISMRAVRH